MISRDAARLLLSRRRDQASSTADDWERAGTTGRASDGRTGPCRARPERRFAHQRSSVRVDVHAAGVVHEGCVQVAQNLRCDRTHGAVVADVALEAANALRYSRAGSPDKSLGVTGASRAVALPCRSADRHPAQRTAWKPTLPIRDSCRATADNVAKHRLPHVRSAPTTSFCCHCLLDPTSVAHRCASWCYLVHGFRAHTSSRCARLLLPPWLPTGSA